MELIDTWHRAYSEIAKALNKNYRRGNSARKLYQKLEKTRFF